MENDTRGVGNEYPAITPSKSNPRKARVPLHFLLTSFNPHLFYIPLWSPFDLKFDNFSTYKLLVSFLLFFFFGFCIFKQYTEKYDTHKCHVAPVSHCLSKTEECLKKQLEFFYQKEEEQGSHFFRKGFMKSATQYR